MNKIPYMVIVGEKEMESGRLTVRLQEGKNLELISIDEFLQQLFERIQQRK